MTFFWKFAIFVLTMCSLARIILGFSTGAPENTCLDPTTFHTEELNASHVGLIMQQNTSSNPYVVDASTSYIPGGKVKVTIHSPRFGIPFRGFFLQMLSEGTPLNSQWRTTHGQWFNTTTNERPLWCASLLELGINRRLNLIGGITHTNNMDKQSATVDWIAPSRPVGTVQVVASIVRQFSTFWIDVRSKPISLYQSPGHVGQQPSTPGSPAVPVRQQAAQVSQEMNLGSQPNIAKAPAQSPQQTTPPRTAFNFGIPGQAGTNDQQGPVAQGAASSNSVFDPQTSFQAPGFFLPAQG